MRIWKVLMEGRNRPLSDVYIYAGRFKINARCYPDQSSNIEHLRDSAMSHSGTSARPTGRMSIRKLFLSLRGILSGLGSSSSYLPARYLVSRYPSCVICTSGSGWTTEVATFESLMIALSVFKKAVCRAAKPKLASVTERPERRKGAGLLPSARPKKRQSSDVENTPTCIVSTCPCPMAKVTGTQLRSSPNRSSSD